MVGMVLNVDATPFSSALKQTFAYILQSIEASSDIPVIELFDTPALQVQNASGRQQLEARAPLHKTDDGWLSTGSFVPMRLRYQLYQGNEPLRMDVTVKGDLVLTVATNQTARVVEVTLLSDFSSVILDPVRVGGQTISISDVLYLKRISLRAGVIEYAFRRRTDSEDYIAVVAAWTESGVEEFKGQSMALKFSRENFATKALSTSLAKVLKADACGPGGGGGPGSHTLWARSSNGSTSNGTCYISAGCGTDTNPRAYKDINLGCYPSSQDAWAASDTHPMCQLGNFLDAPEAELSDIADEERKGSE